MVESKSSGVRTKSSVSEDWTGRAAEARMTEETRKEKESLAKASIVAAARVGTGGKGEALNGYKLGCVTAASPIRDARKGLCSGGERGTWIAQAPGGADVEGDRCGCTIHPILRDLDSEPLQQTVLASAMQTFRYPHLPQELSTVHVALFTNVTNSADIRSRIIRASQLEGPEGDAERNAVNFAFIDARLVRAANRSLHLTLFIHVRLRSAASCISKLPSTRQSSPKRRAHCAQKPSTQRSCGPSTPQTMQAFFFYTNVNNLNLSLLLLL